MAGQMENTHLRNLRKSDAPLMLEWMHDDDVVHFMKADFKNKTLSDCEKFIEDAQDCSQNLHMAVADSEGTYMGTVSLKNIANNSAEFAITMRKAAMGKDYARDGMKDILDKGFNELGLESIYWCVSPDNHRAVRFYDKNGYKRTSAASLKLLGGGLQHRRNFSVHLVSGHKEQITRGAKVSPLAIQLNTGHLSSPKKNNPMEEKDE